MGNVESQIVTQFNGLRKGVRAGTISSRIPLNTPRELLNILPDENGHLLFPRAATDEFHTFTTSGANRIRKILNVTMPHTAIVIQSGEEVYVARTTGSGASTPSLLFSSNNKVPLWSVETEGVLYLGNEDNTWKVTWDSGDGWDYELLDDEDVPPGFDSAMYRGRRYVMDRLKRVWFSELNQPETFGEDNHFTVGGDSSGGEWSKDPGSVVALVEFQDYLAIFNTQSIWLLSGTTPETFQLTRTGSLVGCWARDTVVRTEEGLLFFGGTPRGEFGIYLFTGGMSHLISDPVNWFMREWEKQYDVEGQSLFAYATARFHATRWQDYYVFSMEGAVGRQVFLYDFHRQAWSTFNNWTGGPRIAPVRDGIHDPDTLFVSKSLTVYKTPDAFPRSPGTSGEITLGWHDPGYTTALVRFMGLKLSVWRISGSSDVEIKVDAETEDGQQAQVIQKINPDPYSNVLLPLNLRGKAIEFKMTLTPDSDSDSVLIENCELVFSHKGDKLSRA